MTKKAFDVAFPEKITKKIALELLEEAWNDYIKKYTRFGILLKKKYNFVPVKV